MQEEGPYIRLERLLIKSLFWSQATRDKSEAYKQAGDEPSLLKIKTN